MSSHRDEGAHLYRGRRQRIPKEFRHRTHVHRKQAERPGGGRIQALLSTVLVGLVVSVALIGVSAGKARVG